MCAICNRESGYTVQSKIAPRVEELTSSMEGHTVLPVRFNSKQKYSLQAQPVRSNVRHPTASLIHCVQTESVANRLHQPPCCALWSDRNFLIFCGRPAHPLTRGCCLRHSIFLPAEIFEMRSLY